ncbi:hypothetical protein [Nocardioides sp. AE5]|uniref:hypothetical protein n=1 Tax=Nocardioides sp. AE5 TaxID=2962573 RepID=UPI002882A563|nr:hypothetical protein [Nocardioides sp. AE5]MDT0203851.1 hypothetical protein [Nocardioides sp. AE5]
MLKNRTVLPAAAAAVLALGLLAGCSGDEESDSPGGGGGGGTASFAEEFSVRGALAEIPEGAIPTDGVLTVAAGDLRAATEMAGLEWPAEGTREATGPWLMALTTGAEEDTVPFVPISGVFNVQSASADEFAEAAGWSILDVDRFVEVETAPRRFAVVAGDFDDDTLSPDLVEVGDGIVSDRDAEDLSTDLAEQGPLNPIGQPIRMAQDGDRIAVSTVTDLVADWLSGGETLADREPLAAVADALDQRQVVSAYLGEPGDAASTGLTPDQLQATGVDLDALPSFDMVGMGWTEVDGEAKVHVAYHFADEAAATAGADYLEELYRNGRGVTTGGPFSDFLAVDEVTTEGSVVVVSTTAVPGRQRFLFQAYNQRELMFVSG